MNACSRYTIIAAAGLVAVLLASVEVDGQAPPADTPQMVEDVFTNVQVLKGIPVDEFLDTMGMFSASLGFDCVSCHSREIENADKPEAFAISTPRIQMARSMLRMMNLLNSTYFGGTQRVTCFTCHTGGRTPSIVPSLAIQYGELIDDPYQLQFFPSVAARPADDIFDRYRRAIGGREPLAKVTSLVAAGTYAGYDTGLQEVPVEIFAQAPDKRTVIAHGRDGDSIWTTDGRNAWKAQPNTPIPVMTMTGGNVAGARLEAMVAFPGGLQEAVTGWQPDLGEIDGRMTDVLRGTYAGNTPVALYFDESGLLIRMIRWTPTAVGPVPTQTDYGDYRDVAGIKVPFGWKTTWTGGEVTVALTDVRPNVSIDPARFLKPPGRR
jgi:outer membrane lipoprotein-sorting protein